MAAQIAAEVEKASGTPVTIEAGTLQRVLESHVRKRLEALGDFSFSGMDAP